VRERFTVREAGSTCVYPALSVEWRRECLVYWYWLTNHNQYTTRMGEQTHLHSVPKARQKDTFQQTNRINYTVRAFAPVNRKK
jgi:hypothetical protein